MLKRKPFLVVLSLLTAFAMLFSSQLAFAADNTASVGVDATNGSTNLNFKYLSNDEQSTSGNQIAFTVPSSLNYVVKSNGELLGATTAKINNKSEFQIYVSKLQATAESDYTLKKSGEISSATADNCVSVQVGPTDGVCDLANFTTATAPTAMKDKWAMAHSSGAVTLSNNSGKAVNLTKDLTSDTKFATIKWTVKAGNPPTA